MWKELFRNSVILYPRRRLLKLSVCVWLGVLGICMNCETGFSASVVLLDKAAQVNFKLEQLQFLPNGRLLLLIGKRDGKGTGIALFDVRRAKVISISLLTHSVQNFVVDGVGKFAYYVGTDVDGSTIISRQFISDQSIKSLVYPVRLVEPAIAISDDEGIYVSGRTSGLLERISADAFEEANDGPVTLRASSNRIAPIIFRDFLPSSIEIDSRGDYLFASHSSESAVSAFDLRSGRLIEKKLLGKGTSASLSQVATVQGGLGGSDSNADSIVTVIDDDALMAILDLNIKFKLFETIGVVELDKAFLAASKAIRKGTSSPGFLLASSKDEGSILVAAQSSNRVSVFGRQGRLLEQRESISLPFRPIDLAVSSDGGRAAAIGRGNTLMLLDDISIGTAGPDDDPLTPVKEVQRGLLSLGYPVGVVNGVEGRRSRDAVGRFQEGIGLKPTGMVDQRTLEAVRSEIAKNPRATDIFTSALIDVAKKKWAFGGEKQALTLLDRLPNLSSRSDALLLKARIELGMAERGTGDYTAAIGDFRSALEQNDAVARSPEISLARIELSEVLLLGGRFAEAKQEAEKFASQWDTRDSYNAVAFLIEAVAKLASDEVDFPQAKAELEQRVATYTAWPVYRGWVPSDSITWSFDSMVAKLCGNLPEPKRAGALDLIKLVEIKLDSKNPDRQMTACPKDNAK